MSVSTINGGMQPWNRVIFPGSESNYPLLPLVTPKLVRSIPGMARVLQLIAGMAKQMPLDQFAGDNVLPRPRLLDQPDPEVARSWWVDVQVQDYLLHGNALHYVTSRDVQGYPLTTSWIPAEWVSITWTEDRRGVQYWCAGRELDPEQVIHVRRGADPWCPHRGVGVVEQHMMQWARITDQESYESGVLKGAAVPSVAVIAPNPSLTQDEADEAKAAWMDKFDGPRREPAILPNGTQVIPLAWSPHDAEMVEARKLGLLDIANMANLDGYWVGAPAGSFTYRSPGPMYLNLVRQTINPILEDFEGEWSRTWLPRGRRVRFDRTAVLRDDMQTMVTTLSAAVSAKILTQSEARTYLGYSAELPEELKAGPVPAALQEFAGQDPAGDDQEDNNDE